MLRQLLRRQGWAKVPVALAHQRQRQLPGLGRQAVVARLAAALGDKADSTILFEAAQQPEHLVAFKPDQCAGVCNTQPARRHAQQHAQPIEFPFAHRHHRHGASPGTLDPGGVSPQLCTRVSSLYCAYKRTRRVEDDVDLYVAMYGPESTWEEVYIEALDATDQKGQAQTLRWKAFEE